MNLISLIVSVLFSIVNYFLLICTCKLLRKHIRQRRIVLGAVFAGFFCVACIHFPVLNSWLVYLVALICICIISFDLKSRWITASSVYLMLTISLGGLHIGTRGIVSLVLGTLGLFLVLLISNRNVSEEYIDVRFFMNNEYLNIKALIDSGNLLTDPITGETVLLVSADVANCLTGLTQSQLRNPIDNLSMIKGLRLLPYSTISEKGNFLLAKKMDNVQIGSKALSILVAFCPEQLSSNGKFQALVGGRL